MPDRIGPWLIGDPLGRGQSGEVFEVTETVAPFRHGALKIHQGKRVKVSRETFLRESQFIEDQPIPGFMPRFYGSGELEDHTRWFVMEFADKPPAHLSRDQVVNTVDRIAKALQQLDEKKYYHGDIKPNNIGLIDGKAALLDFGSVCTHQEAASLTIRLGTPHYMAPELKRKEGGTVSVRTDMFSLGMTLEELRADKDERVFNPLVRHATAFDPADRPTLAVFRQELQDAVPSYRRDAASESRVEKVKAVIPWVCCVMTVLGIVYLTFKHVINMRREDYVRQTYREDYNSESDYQTAINDYQKGDISNALKYLKYVVESKSRRTKQADRMIRIIRHQSGALTQ